MLNTATQPHIIRSKTVKREKQVAKKRVLKLTNYPGHARKLVEIAKHFRISSSLALQIIIAYQTSIYSRKKLLKRYLENEQATAVWIDFYPKAHAELEAALKEEELTYTDFCKRRIADFYLAFKDKQLKLDHSAFKVFLPKM